MIARTLTSSAGTCRCSARYGDLWSCLFASTRPGLDASRAGRRCRWFAPDWGVQVERRVDFGDGSAGNVSLNEPVLRHGKNPILTAHQVNAVWTEPHLRVMTVHNAGVAVVGSETVMLFRSHLRCGISVIGLARSNDGIADWRIGPRPFLQPATATDQLAPSLDPAEIAEMEAGGVEDTRINPVDGTYAITYSGYSTEAQNRVRVLLAVSDDFTAVTRFGPVLAGTCAMWCCSLNASTADTLACSAPTTSRPATPAASSGRSVSAIRPIPRRAVGDR